MTDHCSISTIRILVSAEVVHLSRMVLTHVGLDLHGLEAYVLDPYVLDPHVLDPHVLDPHGLEPATNILLRLPCLHGRHFNQRMPGSSHAAL